MIEILKLAVGIVAIAIFIVIFGPMGQGDEDTAAAPAEPKVRTMSGGIGSAKFQSVAPRN